MVPRPSATTTTTTTATSTTTSKAINVPKCKCKENQILLVRVNDKLISVKDKVKAVKEATASSGTKQGSGFHSNKSTYELILKRAMTSIVQHTIPITCYKDALTLKHIGPNIAMLMFPPSLLSTKRKNSSPCVNDDDESDNDNNSDSNLLKAVSNVSSIEGEEKENNNNSKKRKARVSKKTSKSSIQNDNTNANMTMSTTGSLLHATTTAAAAAEERNNNNDSPLRTQQKQASKKKQKVATTSSTTSTTNNTVPITTTTTTITTDQNSNQHKNNNINSQQVPVLSLSKKHTQYNSELYKSQQQQQLYFNKGYIWRVVLLIDCREHQSSHVISKCRMSGIPCEERTLPIGDMVWIAQGFTSNSTSSSTNDKLVIELILGTIIERKSIEDLRSSIYGTRYFEQRIRLRDSGIQQLIYLIEGNKNKDLYMCPRSTLHTAEWETRLYYNFSVLRTNHIDETIIQLKRIHRRIVQRTFPTSFYNEALPTFHECTIVSNSSTSNNNINNNQGNRQQQQQQRRRYRRRRVQSLFELSFDIDPVVPQFTYNNNNCTSSSSSFDEQPTTQQQQRFITYNELKTKIEYDRESCTRTVGAIHQAMLKQVSTLSTIKCHSISKLFTTPNQLYQFYSNYYNKTNSGGNNDNNLISTGSSSSSSTGRQIVTSTNSLLNTQQQHQNHQQYKYLLANIPLRENNYNTSLRNHTVDNRSLIGQRSSTEIYIAYAIQSDDTTTTSTTTSTNNNNRITNPYDCRHQSPSYEELVTIRNSYCSSPNKTSILTIATAQSNTTTNDDSTHGNNQKQLLLHDEFDLQSTNLSNSTSQSTVMIIDDGSNNNTIRTNNSNKTATNQITIAKPGKVNKPASSSTSPLIDTTINTKPIETDIPLVRMTSTNSSLDNEVNGKVSSNARVFQGKVDSPSTQQTNISESYDFFDGTPLVDKKKGGKITDTTNNNDDNNKNCESHISNIAIDLSLDDDTDDDDENDVEHDKRTSQLLFSSESSKGSSNISRQSMRNQCNDIVIANENKLTNQLSSTSTPSNNKTYKNQHSESLSTRRSSYDTYKSSLSSDFYHSDDDLPLFESIINTTRTGCTTGSCEKSDVVKSKRLVTAVTTTTNNNDSSKETTVATNQNMKSLFTISCFDNRRCGPTTQMEQHKSVDYTKSAECEIVAATGATCRSDAKTAPSSLLKSLQISLLSDDDDDD